MQNSFNNQDDWFEYPAVEIENALTELPPEYDLIFSVWLILGGIWLVAKLYFYLEDQREGK